MKEGGRHVGVHARVVVGLAQPIERGLHVSQCGGAADDDIDRVWTNAPPQLCERAACRRRWHGGAPDELYEHGTLAVPDRQVQIVQDDRVSTPVRVRAGRAQEDGGDT